MSKANQTHKFKVGDQAVVRTSRWSDSPLDPGDGNINEGEITHVTPMYVYFQTKFAAGVNESHATFSFKRKGTSWIEDHKVHLYLVPASK